LSDRALREQQPFLVGGGREKQGDQTIRHILEALREQLVRERTVTGRR
jgi:hypothetical protein